MIKPILFNAEMVRAVLDGRKTVTRRKIDVDTANQFDVEHDGKTVACYINPETGDCYSPTEICKYQPGDILYVRETWKTKCSECEEECSGMCNAPYYVYKADCQNTEGKWRPSIHMPKEATRIWLKVTDVRAERLQEMTQVDFMNEGVNTCKNCASKDYCLGLSSTRICYLKSDFIKVWDTTLKKSDLDRYGWNANPWVWVIEFERCEKPEGWCV